MSFGWENFLDLTVTLVVETIISIKYLLFILQLISKDILM